MSGRQLRPGEINIDKFELTNFSRSEAFATSIEEIAYEFSYYEDIFSPTISADIYMVDGINLINDFPIIGEEDLFLSFGNPLNDELIDLNLRSYKVGERNSQSQRTLEYQIYFASENAILDPKTQVVSAFSGRISDIVTKFFPFVEIEPTDGQFKYVGNSMTRFETMAILAREAKSQNNLSSSYLFYETSEGYHFVTLEYLFEKPTAQTYYYILSNANRDDAEIKDDLIISQLEYIKSNDLIEGMRNGLYGNTTSAIDLIRKTYNSRTFDYFGGGFDKTKHIPESPSRLQPNFRGQVGGPYVSFARDSSPANEKYFVSDLNDVADIEYIKEYDPSTNNFGRNRHIFSGVETSLRNQTKSIAVRIAIPGDSTRHAGDIIELKIPENNPSNEGLREYDKYLSGRFLVTNVRHGMKSNREYVTVMECVKDSFEDEIRSNLERGVELLLDD